MQSDIAGGNRKLQGIVCIEWTYLIQMLFELVALLRIDLVSCNLLLAALGPNFIRAHPADIAHVQ